MGCSDVIIIRLRRVGGTLYACKDGLNCGKPKILMPRLFRRPCISTGV